MAEIILVINDRRLKALEETMRTRGVSVERYMQERLNHLYSAEVPFVKYQETEKLIREDKTAEETEAKQSGEAPASEKKFPVLEGKDVLRSENAVFRDYFFRDENLLAARLTVNPALCDILGVHDNIWKPVGLTEAYIYYDMNSGQLVPDMEVCLCAGEEKTETFLRPLSAEEKSMLLSKMDEHIRKWSGMSLAECTEVYRQEVSAEENDGKDCGKTSARKKRKKPNKER